MRDRYGYIIGRYAYNIITPGAFFVVPHYGMTYPGSYYVVDNNYYYYPQTVSTDTTYYESTQPVQLVFGGFGYVDDLSGRLAFYLNELCVDLHHNYSHNPNFNETYRGAYELLQTAKYIHDNQSVLPREEIVAQVTGMEGYLYYLYDELSTWTRVERQTVGTLGLQSRLDLIEATLQHLMYDVGIKPETVGPTSSVP